MSRDQTVSFENGNMGLKVTQGIALTEGISGSSWSPACAGSERIESGPPSSVPGGRAGVPKLRLQPTPIPKNGIPR